MSLHHKNNPIVAENTWLKTKEGMRIFKMNEDPYYEKNPFVEENVFLTASAYQGELPRYEDVKEKLPKPVWEGHDAVLACYDRVFQIAFEKMRPANEEARIVSPFIDCAFYDFTFMWDSCFIAMFAKYASRVFDFQGSLDNFYAHQHKDGFICRQLFQSVEGARFSRSDPSSTGPNVLPWSEWEYYLTTKDEERLKKVFPPLLAYHRWLQRNRTWQDGGYWTTGLGSGMDNQPRLEEGYDVMCSHGFMTWIDACAQQYLSADILLKMSAVLGREKDAEWLKEERDALQKTINEKHWDEETAFYYDRFRDGRKSNVKTVGAYWTMLAGLVPKHRVKRFVEHLTNEKEFKRPVMIPTLSADHPEYERFGGYWRGGVWAPTNYMVMKALAEYGYDDLAYEIACNYVSAVTTVFEKDGTVYENYAPEEMRKGEPALGEFVGWTGLAPISILFEYVFGIRPEASKKRIVWHVYRLEKHGVEQYPFGDGCIDLVCEARTSEDEKPSVTVRSKDKIEVEVVYKGGSFVVKTE